MSHETQSFEETDLRVNLSANVVIVIVEDDRGHYLLTQNCLRDAGISNEIVWLQDGSSAMDYFFDAQAGKDHKKHLVLLDIRLPKVDGTVVLEKLKQDERYERMPVVMLTTSEDRQLAHRCYELGCDAHVIKPPGNVLLRAIQRLNRAL